jgi:hypothetical protein
MVNDGTGYLACSRTKPSPSRILENDPTGDKFVDAFFDGDVGHASLPCLVALSLCLLALPAVRLIGLSALPRNPDARVSTTLDCNVG